MPSMHSLGLKTVVAAGTPVQLAAAAGTKVNSINIQPVKSGGPYVANVGPIYVGLAGMNKATLAGVIYILSPTQVGATVEPRSYNLPYQDDLSNYWLDADNPGDGALISYE